jgi:hypothetical protein
MKKYILSLLLIITSANSFAQDSTHFLKDINDFLRVGSDIATAPFNFKQNDWIKLSAVAGVTVISSFADKEIKKFRNKNISGFNDAVFEMDKYYFLPTMAGGIVALYGYGMIDDNTNIRRLAVKLTEATAYSMVIAEALKIFIGRARPKIEDDQYDFNPLNNNNNYNSLPSGHTTLAFAFSTVMANEIDNTYWKVGWYTLASLVSISRIYNNQHWFSDTILGGSVGYFIGDFVSGLETNVKDKVKISFLPMLNGAFINISF